MGITEVSYLRPIKCSRWSCSCRDSEHGC